MRKQEFLTLIDKYLAGKATVEEEQQLLDLFDSYQHDPEWDENVLGAKEQLEEKMFARLQHAVQQSKAQERKKVIYMDWMRNAAAALLLFAVGFGAYHFLNQPAQQPLTANNTHVKHDVEPGKNQAVLTLANGTKVILDVTKNGVIDKKGGISVKKAKDGQLIYTVEKHAEQTGAELAYNTISTPRGGQYQVILPDGSKVWLNAASSLKFPTAFTGTERNVELTGEAYFEVAKNAAKPFNVKVNAMQVQVLGTHFDVMAYSNEDAIRTTLLEGSVKVTNGGKSNMLKPGQQGVVDRNGNIKVVTADLEQAVAWKDGYFEFNRSNIQEIMKQLSRWYDTEVTYEGEVPDDEFVGKIERSVKLSQVLHILELSNVHFRIENKNIIVTP